MRVWWAGRWHHLGLTADRAAWQAEYERLLSAWRTDPAATTPRPALYLVAVLCRDYLESADSPAGGPQRARVITAVELLLQHHLTTAVADFGPAALRAWQSWLCALAHPVPHRKAGLTRFNVTTVGDLVEAVRRVWRWGVSTERVEETRYRALLTVPAPQPGEARDPRDVPPADPAHVKATLPHLRPPARAMVVLQWATGARPEELCGMRAGDVVRGGKLYVKGAGLQDLDQLGVWAYAPAAHKTAWKGKPRFLTFAGDAQKVLLPFLDRDPAAYCFSPAEAVADLRESQRAERAKRKGGSGGSRKPKAEAAGGRRPGDRYTPRTYRQAVERAAARAGVPHWFPYQLRHLAAAEVKELFDLDAVQALLGHHTRTMAEHYGGVAFKKAAEVARKRGGGG